MALGPRRSAPLRTLALVLLLPSALAGQEPVAMPLAPANGTVTAAFTNVRSMHELQNGTVLLSDAMTGLIGIGNFATGKFEPIPNLGGAPLVALPGDSTLMWGIGTALWVFLVGARPIGMLPADNPVVAMARMVDGADAAGHVLVVRDMPVPGDSLDLVLVTRSTAAQEPVGRMWTLVRPAPGGLLPPYHIYEEALLTLDGWLAVVRIAPYRVDWRAPDGQWIHGAPIPVRVVKMDDREKQIYMVQQARGGTPASPATIANWPDTVPPWTTGYPPVASLDGKVLVRRTPTADLPATRYDVINRRGERERQIVLPANEKVLGFGEKSIYVTVTGAGRIQSVERHPWP